MSETEKTIKDVDYEAIQDVRKVEEFLCVKGWAYRYLAMLLICCTSIATMSNFESVSAYQESTIESLNVTTSEYSLMLSMSAWASIVMGSFEGVLIDKLFGVNVGSLVYLGVYTIGLILIAVAIMVRTFWMALLGGLITGIGTLGFYSCLAVFCVIFFKGKELSFMMSLMISTSRFGFSAMFAMASPLLTYVQETYTDCLHESIGIALFIGMSFLVAAVLFLTILSFMNSADKARRKAASKNFKLKTLFSSIFELPFIYWLIQLCNCCIHGTTFILFPFIQLFLVNHFKLDIEAANTVTSNMAIFAGVISPIIGLSVDKWGRDLILMFSAFVTAIAAHLIMAYAPWTPYVGLTLISIAFGVFCSTVYPLIAYVVPENKLGVAFGMGTSMLGLLYSTHAYAIGALIDNHGYKAMELFLVAHGIVGCVLIIIIARVFNRTVGKWNMSAEDRKVTFVNNRKSVNM